MVGSSYAWTRWKSMLIFMFVSLIIAEGGNVNTHYRLRFLFVEAWEVDCCVFLHEGIGFPLVGGEVSILV